MKLYNSPYENVMIKVVIAVIDTANCESVLKVLNKEVPLGSIPTKQKYEQFEIPYKGKLIETSKTIDLSHLKRAKSIGKEMGILLTTKENKEEFIKAEFYKQIAPFLKKINIEDMPLYHTQNVCLNWPMRTLKEPIIKITSEKIGFIKNEIKKLKDSNRDEVILYNSNANKAVVRASGVAASKIQHNCMVALDELSKCVDLKGIYLATNVELICYYEPCIMCCMALGNMIISTF